MQQKKTSNRNIVIDFKDKKSRCSYRKHIIPILVLTLRTNKLELGDQCWIGFLTVDVNTLIAYGTLPGK